MADDRHNTNRVRTETAEMLAGHSEQSLKVLVDMLNLNIEQKFEMARRLELMNWEGAHAIARNIRAIAESERRH